MRGAFVRPYESPGWRPTLEQGATLFGSAAMRPPGIWHDVKGANDVTNFLLTATSASAIAGTEPIAMTEQQRIGKHPLGVRNQSRSQSNNELAMYPLGNGSLQFLVLLEQTAWHKEPAD